jgi:hypothetical protein
VADHPSVPLGCGIATGWAGSGSGLHARWSQTPWVSPMLPTVAGEWSVADTPWLDPIVVAQQWEPIGQFGVPDPNRSQATGGGIRPGPGTQSIRPVRQASDR